MSVSAARIEWLAPSGKGRLGMEGMKRFGIAAIVLLVAVRAYAGASDGVAFFNAPVLGEAGLLALAVATGLVGVRFVRKYHKE